MSKHVNTTGRGVGMAWGFGMVALILGGIAWLERDVIFPQNPDSGRAHNADTATPGGN